MLIGSHVNFGVDQLLGSANQAISYDANCFMFYTGAPQNTRRSAIKKDYLEKAKTLMKENGIDINNVICHAPYIINLANKENTDSWHFSINFLKQELDRITTLGIKYIVVHPGNALKLDRNIALSNIVEALNEVLEHDGNSTILIETMAGKGSECGINIAELKTILSQIKKQDRIGICLDTCHLNDSGIDISKWDNYLDEFDQEIGLYKVKCIHINDSKNPIGAKKDRHANLGYGTIGFDNLINVIYNERLKNVPKILETPWIGDYAPYKEEIKMIKTKTFNPHLEQDVLS